MVYDVRVGGRWGCGRVFGVLVYWDDVRELAAVGVKRGPVFCIFFKPRVVIGCHVEVSSASSAYIEEMRWVMCSEVPRGRQPLPPSAVKYDLITTKSANF